MQLLRSHIIKWCFISLICTGFGLYMAKPVHAEDSAQAFSSWIGTVVDDASGSNLMQELNTLSESGADIYKLMQYASRHMSKADQQFDLPLSEDDATDHIMQVLLQQWNHFKTGNGMATVPPPEIVKAVAGISIDKYSAAGGHSYLTHSIYRSFPTSSRSAHYVPGPYKSLDPMSVGIAIGAP